jgi:hypothetical protein
VTASHLAPVRNAAELPDVSGRRPLTRVKPAGWPPPRCGSFSDVLGEPTDTRNALFARRFLSALRIPQHETQLTQVLAATFSAEPEMATGFVAAALDLAPHGHSLRLPEMMSCVAEQRIDGGRADLVFSGDVDGHEVRVVVELKINATYNGTQLAAYVASCRPLGSRAAVVAITRDLPVHDPPYEPGGPWRGSVRWGRLAHALQALQPRSRYLAEQWPILLDLLEGEGTLGFTTPKPDMFEIWARSHTATQHVHSLFDAVEGPFLEDLRTLLTTSSLDSLRTSSPSYRLRRGRPLRDWNRHTAIGRRVDVLGPGYPEMAIELFGPSSPPTFLIHVGPRPIDQPDEMRASLERGGFVPAWWDMNWWNLSLPATPELVERADLLEHLRETWWLPALHTIVHSQILASLAIPTPPVETGDLDSE